MERNRSCNNVQEPLLPDSKSPLEFHNSTGGWDRGIEPIKKRSPSIENTVVLKSGLV
jgi:hypothetical protein